MTPRPGRRTTSASSSNGTGPRSAPSSQGKIHVDHGRHVDTFYLEGAVRLFKESLETLGSDAVVEIVPGRDHATVIDATLAERLDREMQRRRETPRP